MKNNLDQHRDAAKLGRRDDAIYEFLAMKHWTPAMAAQLVAGIRAESGSINIPEGGVGLDNQLLSASSSRFHEARRIFRDWIDWFEDSNEEGSSGSASQIDPIDFFAWCEDEGIETDWLKLFRIMAGCPSTEQIDAAASPLLRFGVSNPRPAENLENAARHPDKHHPAVSASRVHKLNSRRNALTTVIDMAVELAGDDVTSNVFFQLRGLALEGHAPFTGGVDESGLQYSDGDKPRTLDKSGLGKRLERRRKRL